MFFQNTKICEIGEEIPDETLQKFLNKKEIRFRVSDSESHRWTASAICRHRKNEFNSIRSM